MSEGEEVTLDEEKLKTLLWRMGYIDPEKEKEVEFCATVYENLK